jgi:hypothetical protein
MAGNEDIEHFPEKWTPVFRKEMRQHKDLAWKAAR